MNIDLKKQVTVLCPACSSEGMKNKYAEEFPSIGTSAFRALMLIKKYLNN